MRILVSACLLGVNCRYNGIPKEDAAVKGLLSRKDIALIPVCPEQLGGLPTPRTPSERKGDGVVSSEGEDRTEAFNRGALEALRLAKLYGCEAAILKERSPSCGNKEVYDGSFTGIVVPGEGVTAELLRKNGVKVFGESEMESFLEYVRRS
ncbi:MAG: DUF523 domain-containing protein [Lachnospiraceae bacterium]|nr:DUF523 domain-containing protein [Lachnospiraceae bacterium]